MNDNEKLIEDAEKAIEGVMWPIRDIMAVASGGNKRGAETAFNETVQSAARVALSVFEKAHTPTDDEREALITIEHEGGNTVTGTPEQVLNHGHLKPGWRYRSSEPQREPSDAQKPRCGGGRTNCRNDQWPPMHTMACPISKARHAVTEQGGSNA